MSKSITQDMRYRQSLMQYAAKYGVSRASRKYNKSRSYIYYWKARWDGSVASLGCQSRRPHHHPNQHTEAELKLIRDMRRRNPTLGMLEFWHRLRKRGYTRRPESLFRVMRKLGMFPQPKVKAAHKAKPYEQMQYPGQRVQVECVQTDNGIEFTNRFSTNKKDRLTRFELTAARLGIRHKLIRPYTPRHNGKVERSHREDQKRFYDSHRFYSLADFGAQLAAHQNRSNNLPMRPLAWLSPKEKLSAFFNSLPVQDV